MQRLAREFPIQGLFRQVHVEAHGRVENEVGAFKWTFVGESSSRWRGHWELPPCFCITRWTRCLVGSQSARTPSPTPSSSRRYFFAEQRPFLLRAIRAYIEQDWLSFIYVLVPQIELAILTLVIL